MRNTSNELFNLIKSLSKSEKGYFKKFSALHIIGKQNKYLKLFSLIDKQKVYDEKTVKDAFNGDPFAVQLHVAKNYLHKMILKSLNQYYQDSTISIRLNNLINTALILYRKGLFDESWKVLLKCKTNAIKNEKYESLLLILNLEKKLMAELYPREYSDKAIKNTAEKINVNKKILSILNFEDDLNKLRALYHLESITRKKVETEPYDKIMNGSGDSIRGEEFESKLYFYEKLLFYSWAIADDLKTLEYSKKLTRLLESNPEYIKEFTNDYVSVLNMYLNAILFLKNYGEGDKIIKNLNSLKPLSLKLQNRIQIMVFNFVLTKYIFAGQFEKCLKLIPQIEGLLKLLPYDERKSNEEKFNYSLSYVYFGLGNYEIALQYINKILNDKDKNTKIDLLSFAHILNLILHYELNNTELLPYIIKNTYRFFLRRKKLYNFEREILGFIRIIPDLMTKQQQIDAFQEIKENIIKITKDPYERIALDYFDFISWLESKIEGKKFSDVVKHKRLLQV
jgi:hypothetical protein